MRRRIAVAVLAVVAPLACAQNVVLGPQAGLKISTLSGEVFIGEQAGMSVVGGGPNEFAPSVAIGMKAMKWHTDGGSIAIGAWALGGNLSSSTQATSFRNVAIGRNALGWLTQGPHNTAVGDSAGQLTTVGGSNSFFGRASGSHNVVGGFNTYAGHASGFYATGSSNTFVGNQAGNAGPSSVSERTGNFNTAVGELAGPLNLAGSYTVALGKDAGTALDHTTVIGAHQSAAYVSGRLAYGVAVASVSGAAQTYTAAQLLGGVILRSGAGVDTTPTAAQIVTAIPGCEPGAGTYLEIVAPTGSVTLAAGAGITLAGNVNVLAGMTRRYLVMVTSTAPEAVTIMGLGTSSVN